MKGWCKDVTERNVKTNNHAKSRGNKCHIRRPVLGEISNAKVFDAFAGSGRMYRDVWHQAERGYVGCDKKWYPDNRIAYVADNRRVLRAIALDEFNIFDLDAYGSPWEQALIIADRRKVSPGERTGFILTDGSSLNMKMGGTPLAIREVAGFKTAVAGSARLQDEILDRALIGLGQRLQSKLLHRWDAVGKTGAKVRYIGLVFEGRPA